MNSQLPGQYNVLDLFSGAGGLTEGFIRAGFNIVSHVEMDSYASRTLHTRMLYHKLVRAGKQNIYWQYMSEYDTPGARERFLRRCSDAGIDDYSVINSEISFENRDKIAEIVFSRLKCLENNKIDVIIGGPPCQAYSMMRRWDQIKNEYKDPKGFLYQHYLYYLKLFQPRVFIFENVPGLTSMNDGKRVNDIREGFEEAGYNIDMQILNAADYGVVQERKRVIFVGWRNPETHPYPDFKKKKLRAAVRDLLMADLPHLQAGEGAVVQEYADKPTAYLTSSGIRKANPKVVLHHVARPHTEQDREIYRIAARALEEGKRIKYTELPEELQSHSNKSVFLDRFKVVNPDGCSHSVVSHLSKDGHYFIHPDVSQARSLTVREAARIQSFPDDYIFEGPRTSQFVQIGNAVPPLMSRVIADKIREMLDSGND